MKAKMEIYSMRIIGLVALFSLATTAEAATISQKRANEMVTILNSAAVQALLLQEDGVGNLESISFFPSLTEASNYQMRFSAFAGLSEKTCLSLISVLDGNVTVADPQCES